MIPIIMPVRARLDLTQNAIQSCLAQDVPVELTVILNGVEKQFEADLFAWAIPMPQAAFRVIALSPAKALSAVWNEQLLELFLGGAEEVLVINNDVVLRPDTARVLHEQPGGIVTAVGVNSTEQSTVWDGKIVRRPHPDFSCFMIRRWAYALVGAFDETFYPAFMEDQEIHRRFQLLEVPCDCVGIPFLHVGAGSQTVKSDQKVMEEVREWGQIRMDYYQGKWGGLWPDEVFKVPFNVS